jgi:hypothetical protein
VCVCIYIERERRIKGEPYAYTYILLGSRLHIVPTHIYIFLCEFFTAQLNTIDDRVCVFDIDLYIGENERKKNEIDS